MAYPRARNGEGLERGGREERERETSHPANSELLVISGVYIVVVSVTGVASCAQVVPFVRQRHL